MRPAGPGVKLTYDDLLLFPDDGLRHELIDGEHYVTPSPSTNHQAIAGNLHWMLALHVQTMDEMRRGFAEMRQMFSEMRRDFTQTVDEHEHRITDLETMHRL